MAQKLDLPSQKQNVSRLRVNVAQNAPGPNRWLHCRLLVQPQDVVGGKAPQRVSPPPTGRRHDPPFPQTKVWSTHASLAGPQLVL